MMLAITYQSGLTALVKKEYNIVVSNCNVRTEVLNGNNEIRKGD